MAKRRARRQEKSKKSTLGLKAGVAVVLVAVIVFAVMIRTSGPWMELSAKYPGRDGGNYRFGRDTVELRGEGQLGVAVHREVIAIDWGESALSLAMRKPLGWFFRPLRVPTTAIASCQRRSMSGAWTGIELWVADAGIGIGFPRYDEKTVLDWCRGRGIQIIADKPAAQ